MIKNILIKQFKTEYGSAPFSKIKNEDFLPAFKQAIIDAKADIDAITNKETPSFKNTIEALDFSGNKIANSLFLDIYSTEFFYKKWYAVIITIIYSDIDKSSNKP